MSKWGISSRELLAIGSLTMVLISLALLSSCSSTVFVEDCVRVTPRYNIWKCKR